MSPDQIHGYVRTIGLEDEALAALAEYRGNSITPRKPTPTYQARKDALTDAQVRLSLDLVEELIAVDPFHRAGRQAIGELIYDRTEPAILVVFTMIGDEAMLVAFRDLLNA